MASSPDSFVPKADAFAVRVVRAVRQPLFASMLRSRLFVAISTGIAAGQLTMSAAHVAAWPCPMLHLTGIPCPGCGLTRSTLLVLHGDLGNALRLHAFGPVLLVALLLMAVSLILPDAARRRFIDGLERYDARFGITGMLLAALMVYWVARLCIPGYFAAMRA